MSNPKTLFISVLGGLGLLLGLTYGFTARDYRDAELGVLTDKVTILEESNAHLSAKADEISVLQEKIAGLEAALAAKPDPVVAQAEEKPETAAEAPTATTAQVFGDATKGEAVFKKCQACHQVGRGAEDRIGPHLNGIFGRRAGAHANFKYSADMAMMGGDGLTWTLETLDAYLENPKALVSRTRMNFAGLKKSQDRADILAYLRIYSDDPGNIPEAEPTASREVQLSEDVLAIEGDPDYGEYLSTECTTCHQTDGGDDGIPSITSWPEEDFVIAMHAYKIKLRPHPVMQMMAGRLSDEEIAALAAYFGNLE